MSKKVSNTDIAERIGTSRQMLEAVAHGHRNFRPTDALKAAKILGPSGATGHLIWCIEKEKNAPKRTELLEGHKA